MNSQIVVNGVVLHTYRSGGDRQEPTIIFLHDSLGCTVLWRDFPERLGTATGCDVLVYDRQGYGQSEAFTNTWRDNDYLEREAAVLHALMQACGIKKAILFGHSDGGSIALIAAAKYPDHIKSVITEGAHIFVEDITLAGIRNAVQAYTATNLKEKLQKYHGDKTGAVFRAWADTWLRDGFRSWNIEHFLPLIQCPVLVIQGEQDEYGSAAQVQGIADQVSSGTAETFIVPAAGHTPHKDAADAVLERAADFIRRL